MLKSHGYEIVLKVMDNFHVKLFIIQKKFYNYMQVIFLSYNRKYKYNIKKICTY